MADACTRQLDSIDDHLAVYDDAAGLLCKAKQKIPAMALQATEHEQTGVGRTQSMPLSAAIKQRLVCSAQGGPYSMLRSAAATNFAFPPSAQR